MHDQQARHGTSEKREVKSDFYGDIFNCKCVSVSQTVSRENEDPRGANLGLPIDSAGLDIYSLLHGHGGLEGDLHRWAGWKLNHHCGLVLVQPLEGLLHRLHRCH